MNKPSIVNSKRSEFNPVLDKLFKNAGITNDSKVEQYWEQLETLYQTLAVSIGTIGAETNEAVRQIRENGITENAELAVTIRGIGNDLTIFTEDLLKIRSRHAGMTGLVKDGEELTLCLSIFEDYYSLSNHLQAVSFPNLLTVTEFMMNNNKSQAEIDAQNAIDPNVITDVEIKETVNGN